MAKRALHSTLYQQPPRRARAHEQARTRRNPFLWRPLFYQHTIRRDTVLQTYGSRYKLHFVAQCDPHGLREEGVTGRRTLGRGEPTSAVPAAPRPVIAMTTAAISAQPSALHAVHSHFGSRGTPPSKGCRTSVRSAKQVRSARPPRKKSAKGARVRIRATLSTSANKKMKKFISKFISASLFGVLGV